MTSRLHLRESGRRGATIALWPAALLLLSLLVGCASGPRANPSDPLEPFNRGVYQFNDALDTALLKPVASAYRDLTPVRVRQGIGNFFGNLEDVWSFVNNALQFKGHAALDSLKRVGFNTFVGWGGVFDVATEMDIEKHTKDFGHTLGYWGVAPGPYLVLPLLGSSTLRDTVALPVDLKGDIIANIAHVRSRNTATAMRAVDARAALLKASTMLEEAALDPYSFTRDAFLQRRRSVIFDGNPPEDAAGETFPVPRAATLAPATTPAGALPVPLTDSGLAGDEKVKP